MNNKYYILEPEVAGGLGENTIIDNSSHPPKVSQLHYVFDGWLGDCLVESFPCFIFTREVSQRIIESGLSGIEFSELITSLSDTFIEIYGNQDLPEFQWGQITGDENCDFSINSKNELIVSEKALIILKHYQLSNCEIEERER